ncbi:MAG: N-6 DNA methylase [Bacteroidetes bacterium]|nr:N-6 DNA methylase [Bacteroidota bacterium]
MTLDQYIASINTRYKSGNATEHTYRGDLQQLIESLVPAVKATNEPKRQKCGAPDYIITKKEIPVGFIEAKDIGDKDLEGNKKAGNKEQFDRYKGSLGNLIFTDYLDFLLYKEGIFINKVSVGKLTDHGIEPLKENFGTFENLIKDFCQQKTQTIRSSKRLAEMMAGKARMLADVINKALVSDEKHNEDSSLKEQMQGFKDILIHDITPKAFADVYAQTIAYGMFAARLHDPTLPTFSRQEAAELIPKTNPFLRKLFGYIAGPDIDDRILWIVDDLVEIFLACNVEELLKNHGRSTAMQDPIIHFYETFLSEYDPALRKARGVWYTPEPVVNFIVRAVDDILKTEFGLPMGLADTSKTKIKVRPQGQAKEIEQEVHRVQILDPATGTGTFLAEVVQQIYQQFEGQHGVWSNYVENHLIPRLNGFELLMASYAMAHLKLDLLLTETGYRPTKNQRFRVYLTNSLEEHHPETGSLFANWLSTEANEANHIKRDTPVMCVIGNPPYSVSSTNKSEWIEKLTADYKKDLNERNIQPLSDDYIKFIRFGQHFIDKNGSGVLAYISNNSFVDGIIHRQMRKHLLESFDKIYILDLHGNAKKKEVAPDGSPDQNVFDIMQGVSINIFLKTGKKKVGELAEVLHLDLQGKRDFKYDFLAANNLSSNTWNVLKPEAPNYFLVKKDFDESGEYEKGFSLDLLFSQKSSGVETRKDSLVISEKVAVLEKIIFDFQTLESSELSIKYKIDNKSRDWKVETAKQDILRNNPIIRKIQYRPFDTRNIIYTGNSKGINGYPMYNNFKHFIDKENIGLTYERQCVIGEFTNIIISNSIVDGHILGTAFSKGYTAPLYVYPQIDIQHTLIPNTKRTPNFNKEILNQIVEKLGLAFVAEREDGNVCFANNNDELRDEFKSVFAPIDLLDYIYAVLHSPAYREKYKEFLKIDFPRVPYPANAGKFWQLVKLGGEIRQLHLLESAAVNKFITKYPVDGSNVIGKPVYNEGKVYINDTQYFENVPLIAWEFFIGGYQPAQKWLKDRKDRELSFEDIQHYQKIIVALTETDRLMKEIDLVGVV